MKLKDILREQDREKWVNKLEEKLQSGNWRVNDPVIYRGRSTQDEKPVMEKYTTSGRDPQDTNVFVDMLVNKLHEVCYPNFPARNKSRFGTTDFGYAHSFADKKAGASGDVYVVLPAKSATVYYRSADPIEIFSSMRLSLMTFPPALEEWHYGSDKDMMELRKEVPDDFMYLADSIREFVKNKRIEEQFIQELGCVSRLKKLVKQGIQSFDGEAPDWTSNLKTIIFGLDQYFSELERGLPDKEREEDEVTFHGDYLQVQYQVYGRFREKGLERKYK